MTELRFDGRVAIVTGAGGGLGRQHALTLAARGAKIVVNDLGGATDGGGVGTSSAADTVVEEIVTMGGEAIANYNSVLDGELIVQTAIETWGRVDIVVNNAGILRDKSFSKMANQDWDLVYQVHLQGAQRVTKAAWPLMLEQGYGRIIMTASAAGIYGNFGQANYSAAKLGLHGFAQTLAIEGRKKGINVNTIAPIAKSRLTENVFPKEFHDAISPEYVSPMLAWLCHEDCEETSGLFEVGAGYMAKLRWERSKGQCFPLNKGITPEAVAKRWENITDFSESEHPTDVNNALGAILNNSMNPSLGGNEFIDLDVAMKSEATGENSYDERDLAIYALGVGAAADPTDNKELAQVYEMSGEGFKALATYAAMPSLNYMLQMVKETGKGMLDGLNYGLDRLLHGEQYTEIRQTLQPSAILKHRYKVKAVYDKDPNAVVVLAITTTDENGVEVAYNENTAFVRGAGGFGGDRGPSGSVNVPPNREPDKIITETVPVGQGLLYRLSGDWNPLHVDPSFAEAFGFEKPILHGMCTYGYCGRHVTKAFCNNDPRYIKSIKVRFAESVFPGETLETQMWKEGSKVIFETRIKDRNLMAIKNAAVELFDELPEIVEAHNTVVENDTAKDANKLVAEDLFAALSHHVAASSGLVKKVATSFQFNVTNPDSQWFLDLKSGEGKVGTGILDTADVTLDLSEENLIAIISGTEDAQKLYFGGQLGVSGNVIASNNLKPAVATMDLTLIKAAQARRLKI